MTITIIWYYWLIVGMLLILGEMLLPSFTLLWFGPAPAPAAIVVAPGSVAVGPAGITGAEGDHRLIY